MILEAFCEKPPNFGICYVPTGRWSDLLTARNELKGQKESNLQLACVLFQKQPFQLQRIVNNVTCTVCLSNALGISLADPANGARKAAASLGISIWNLEKGNRSTILFWIIYRGCNWCNHNFRILQHEHLQENTCSFQMISRHLQLISPGSAQKGGGWAWPWHVLRWRKPQRMASICPLVILSSWEIFAWIPRKSPKTSQIMNMLNMNCPYSKRFNIWISIFCSTLRNDMILYRSRKPPKVPGCPLLFQRFFHRNSVQSLGKKSSVSTGIRMLSFWSMVGPWHLCSSSFFPSSPRHLRQLQRRQCQMSWVVWRRGHWPSHYGVAVLWVWCNSMQVTRLRFRWF